MTVLTLAVPDYALSALRRLPAELGRELKLASFCTLGQTHEAKGKTPRPSALDEFADQPQTPPKTP